MDRNFLIIITGAIALAPALTHSATSGSFTLVQPMKQFRRLHTATLLSNGKVLVAGGRPLAQAGVSELYDPATQSWNPSGALNTAREFHTATLLNDGRVVVAGGQTANQLLASSEVYEPATGIWTNAGGLNMAREAHTATRLT